MARRIEILLAATALCLTACHREARRFRDDPSPPPAQNPYGNNVWAISQGSQLYRSFNCNGCHASNGGGGMGPPLLDSKWIYGDAPAAVFTSIVEGRPNGMPAFRARLTDQQAWQLTNYVLSMSGQIRMDARSARKEGLNPGTSPTPEPPGESAKEKGREP